MYRAPADPTGARVVVCIERHHPLLCVTSPAVRLQHNEHTQYVDEIHAVRENVACLYRFSSGVSSPYDPLATLVHTNVGGLDPES